MPTYTYADTMYIYIPAEYSHHYYGVYVEIHNIYKYI